MRPVARRRGAPRVVERDDPLTFVLRNRPADDFLEKLLGKPPMIPATIRKSVGIHPESFRRLASNLHEFSLISIQPRRASAASTKRIRVMVRPQIEIQLTKEGENVLSVAHAVRASVRRNRRLLSPASLRHWLPSESIVRGDDHSR